MTNNKTQYMACGACAVSFDENGQTLTSVDVLASDMKRLMAKIGRRSSTLRASSVAHV